MRGDFEETAGKCRTCYIASWCVFTGGVTSKLIVCGDRG